MKARYRIRKKDPRTIPGGFPTRHPDGETPILPYGLWDTVEHRWVDKYGGPVGHEYWCCCRNVAVMRRRYLNHCLEEGFAWAAGQ